MDTCRAINLEELLHFLKEKPSPIIETDLIRRFFPAFRKRGVSEINAKLFRVHFVLYHHLYKLEQKLRIEKRNTRIYIKNIWIYCFDCPPPERCSYFDETRAEFCNKPALNRSGRCSLHYAREEMVRLKGEVEPQDIRAFYLDKENINSIDEKSLEHMLKDMFRGVQYFLKHYDEIDEALEFMSLDMDFSLSRLKNRYRFLSKKYHPDLNEKNEFLFKKLTCAYRVLFDFRHAYT
jgi:hypothetical protein